MISLSLQTGLEWVADFIRSQRSITQYYRIRSSLADYQAAYELYHPGRTFVETLDRTDFIRCWLDTNSHSQEQLRSWHTSMRGFARWLFDRQSMDHNVMFYVSRRDVLARAVPLVRLGRNLQRAITRFQKTFQARCERYFIAAHRWNVHRNRPECQKWSCPEAEEECWLDWLRQLASGPEGALWKRDLIRGLERFFDFLVVDGLLETNHFSSFLWLHPARTELLKSLGNLSPAVVRGARTLRHTPGSRIPAPPLPAWMRAYQEHLENRGRRAGRGSATLSNLRVLNRILEGQTIEKPEQIGADTIQAYLEANVGLEPGASKGSTRYQRLITLRGLCRFLTRRGIQAPIALAEAWPRVRRLPFQPHIYTLNELAQIISGFSLRAKSSPVPFIWQGLEVVVFLLYACGLRAGEALRLCLGEVDLKSQLLLVVKTKFYKERWVPLGAGATRRLSAYLSLRERAFPLMSGAEQPVFLSSRGRAVSCSVLRLLFRRTVDSLGIVSRGTDPPRLHDLRHSMAVHRLYKWYSEGADVQNKLPLLAAYMGHTHYHNTEVYLHLAEDLIRQAGRNFQQSFERVVGEVARAASST